MLSIVAKFICCYKKLNKMMFAYKKIIGIKNKTLLLSRVCFNRYAKINEVKSIGSTILPSLYTRIFPLAISSIKITLPLPS